MFSLRALALSNLQIMKNILIILLFVSSLQVISQNTLSGSVSDVNTGERLPEVHIHISELQKTNISDLDGHFELHNIPNGMFTLQFSFVGYETHIEKIVFPTNTESIKILMHPSFVESQEVVVSAGTSNSQHENAIKIESIKAEALAQKSGMSLMESLSHQPGVSMITKGQGVITPVIRGLSTTNILVLNNDVRMENFQFSENHPFMIDEAGIDRIEIIKGPASLLYGSDAIGGVINVVKEKPAPVGLIMGDFNMKYFSNTQGIQSNLGIKGSSNDFFWGIRAEQKSHKDYRQGGGVYVPNSRFNGQSAHFFTGINKHYASFKLYYDYDQTKLGLVVPDAISLVIPGERKNQDWFQDLSNHMLISKNKLFLDSWQIDANFSYQNNHRLLKTNHANPQWIATDMLLQTMTYETKAKWSQKSGHSLIIGYAGMYQFNKNGEAPAHVLPDYSLSDNSLFALFQHSMSAHLNAQLGLRYDYRMIAIPTQARSGQNSTNSTETDYITSLNRDYSNISGSLGFTYELSTSWLIRANFASAYRSPNIAELSQDGMHGNRYEQGNRDLKSQRNYELDLSTHYHIKNFRIDLAAFYNHIQNYIFLAPTMDSINSAQVYRYEQSDSKLYGLEAGLEYLVLKSMKLRASYSHIIGIQDNGDYLPFIPQDKLQLALRLKKAKIAMLQKVYFQINTDVVFEQNKPSPFETLTNAYQLLNLSIGSQINISKQKINWQLSVHNLLDTKYYDHLSTLKSMSYYNLGRSVNLVIRIPFGLKK